MTKPAALDLQACWKDQICRCAEGHHARHAWTWTGAWTCSAIMAALSLVSSSTTFPVIGTEQRDLRGGIFGS